MNNFLKNLSAILIAGIYTVSPIDIVPDVVPVAGQVDDIFAIILAIIYIIYNSIKKKEQ